MLENSRHNKDPDSSVELRRIWKVWLFLIIYDVKESPSKICFHEMILSKIMFFLLLGTEIPVI